MVYIPISIIRKWCGTFASETEVAAGIIQDLQGRCGKIKVAECDDGIVLDGEALAVSPGES